MAYIVVKLQYVVGVARLCRRASKSESQSFSGAGVQAPKLEHIFASNTGTFAAGTIKLNGNVGGLGLHVGLKSFPNRSVNKGGFGGPIVV
jgi:hypothetical protein